MINITRLPAPYRDKCSDEWTDDHDRQWAKASDHESYTSQFCLKLCLQKYTLYKCKCWTMAAPPPTESSEVQCDVRQNRGKFLSSKNLTFSDLDSFFFHFRSGGLRRTCKRTILCR